jgi:hypothetical protein
MHPLCAASNGNRDLRLCLIAPLRGMVPLHVASVGKEPRVGAEDGPIPRNRQMRREKEPPVTSLAKILPREAQLQCKPRCKFESVQSPMVAVLTYQKPLGGGRICG